MSLIALDASTSQAGLALLDHHGHVLGSWTAPLKPGLIETLPILLRDAAAGQNITDVAVCTGPGSFTGLRTSIALAQGFAAGMGAVLWGIPVWDAYKATVQDLTRPLWVVIRARKGRVFLLRHNGKAESFADDALPIPQEPIILAGEVAALLAPFLTARGADVVLAPHPLPDASCIGLVAQQYRIRGDTPKPAIPLYVDPPEAKLPAGGLRPNPL